MVYIEEEENTLEKKKKLLFFLEWIGRWISPLSKWLILMNQIKISRWAYSAKYGTPSKLGLVASRLQLTPTQISWDDKPHETNKLKVIGNIFMPFYYDVFQAFML